VTPASPDRGHLLNDVLGALLLTGLAGAWLLAYGQLTSGPLAWLVLRATGLTAYAALTLSVVLGTLTASRFAPSWWPRAMSYGWHGLLSGFALAASAVHGAFLLVDGRFSQTLAGVLVPGRATFEPLPVGLGTVGLELLALVYASTLWRTRLSRRAWKALHLLAYPAFILATLHGLWLGSDNAAPLYVLGVTAATAATALRLLEARRAPPPARPRPRRG